MSYVVISSNLIRRDLQAFCALKHKPPEESIQCMCCPIRRLLSSPSHQAQVIHLQHQYPSNKAYIAFDETPWRERALDLECSLAELQARYDHEQIGNSYLLEIVYR